MSKATVALNYFAAGSNARRGPKQPICVGGCSVGRVSCNVLTAAGRKHLPLQSVRRLRRLSAGATGRDPDQDPDAERNRNRREGMSFGLLAEPVQRLPTRFGTRPHRVVGKVGGLSDCPALAGPEPVFDVLQDRPERIGNLLDGGGRGAGGALTGAVSDDAEFLADAAQMIGDRGNAGLKLR
jgi:hypothetical protein